MYSEKIASCKERLAEALKIKKIKQVELCKLAKIPKSSLSLYLSGAYEPKQDRIYAIAKALDVSEAWLLGYDVAMERRNSSYNTSFSDGEKLMLDLFKQVPEEKQQIVIEMIRAALKTQ